MNSRAKQTDFVKIGLVLVIIAIITFAAMTMTFAKYVTQGSFEDQARVAKWGINIHGNTEANLFDASYKGALPYDQSTTVESADGDHVVAPGTSKEIPLMFIDVDGKAPEVMYDFDVKLSVVDRGDHANDASVSAIARLDQHPGWYWYYAFGDSTPSIAKTHAELEQAINELSKKSVKPNNLPHAWMQEGKGNVIRVGWLWEFEDEAKSVERDKLDTELGNMAARGELDGLAVNLDVSATQVQSTNDKVHTVSFDTNGGSMNPPAQFVNDLEYATKPADPEKEGETFKYWMTSNREEWDFDSDVVTGNMTLFAAYDPKVDLDPSLAAPEITIDRSKTTQTLQVTAGSGGPITVGIKDGERTDVVDIVPVLSNASNDTTKTFQLEALKEGDTVLVIRVAAFKEYAAFEKEIPIHVKSYEMTWVSPEAKTLTYEEGVDQSLVTSGKVVIPSDGGATIYYGLSDSSSIPPTDWKTEVPTGKNAGTYFVWWKITPDAQHGQYNPKDPAVITVTIAKAQIEFNAPELVFDQSAYDGSSHVLTKNGEIIKPEHAQMWYGISDSSSVVPGVWTASPYSVKDVGTYAVWYQVSDNDPGYAGKNPTWIGDVKITKSDIKFVAPTKINDISYDASAHKLLNPGQITWPADAVMSYGLNDSSSVAPATWTTDVPEATDASTYSLWYKVEHTDSGYVGKTATWIGDVTITKADVDYDAPELAFDQSTYDGGFYSLLKPGVINWPTGTTATMQYAVTGSETDVPTDADWQTDVPLVKNAGEYHTWYRIITTDKSINPVDTTYIGVTHMDKAESPMTWSDAKTITKNTDFSTSAISATALAEAKDNIGTVLYKMGENKQHTDAENYSNENDVDENASYSDYFEFNQTSRVLSIKPNANLQYVDIPITAYDPGDSNHNDKTLTCTYTWKVELRGYDKDGGIPTLKGFVEADMKACAGYLENTEIRKRQSEFDSVYDKVVKKFDNDDPNNLGFLQKGITTNGSDNATATCQDYHWAWDRNKHASGNPDYNDRTDSIEFRLIGVLQDEKADGTGPAAFTFMATHGVTRINQSSVHNVNFGPDNNKYKWPDTEVYKYCTNQLPALENENFIPIKVMDDAVEVKKNYVNDLTSAAGTEAEEKAKVATMNCKVFLASPAEIYGPCNSIDPTKMDAQVYPRWNYEGLGESKTGQYKAFSMLGLNWTDKGLSPLNNVGCARGKISNDENATQGSWLRTPALNRGGVTMSAYFILKGNNKPARAADNTRSDCSVTPCFCM